MVKNLRGKPVDEIGLLAGNPRGGPLVFSAIGDLALFAAGQELEDDLFASIEAGPAVILGGGEDQPVASQNCIRAVDGKDLVAPVGIHLQRRGGAVLHFSVDLDADAVIGSGEVGLRACRRAIEDQSGGGNDKKSN